MNLLYVGMSFYGKDVRWATFPSVALGWNFSDEAFMKNFWWLSHGKIRGSWGVRQIFKVYLARWLLARDLFLGVAGLVPSQMENRNLTWENPTNMILVWMLTCSITG